VQCAMVLALGENELVHDGTDGSRAASSLLVQCECNPNPNPTLVYIYANVHVHVLTVC
jgi:hypothetical protein